MKRGLILLAALVIVSGVALGASLSWRGSLYTAPFCVGGPIILCNDSIF